MTTTQISQRAAALVLIPCGKDKRDSAAPAAELYTSSTFRMALASARSLLAPYELGDECIRIVSAKHGLLHTTDVVDPYECTIDSDTAITPQQLRAQAIEQQLLDVACPIMLLPSKYARLIEASGAWDVDTLVDGMAGKMTGETRGTHKHVVVTEDHRRAIVARWL